VVGGAEAVSSSTMQHGAAHSMCAAPCRIDQ
jgi:hypothetical protein